MEKFLFFFLPRQHREFRVRLAITVKVTSLDVDKVNFTDLTPQNQKDNLDVSNHFDEVTHHRRPGRRRGRGRRGADVPRPDRTRHGAFRTLGELNSCEGIPPPTSRSVWATSSTPGPPTVAARAFTQDVDRRILPNWGAAALMFKNRDLATTPA